MTKKTNPRKDFTQRAFDVFQQAIGEEAAEEDIKSDSVETKKIGQKGGEARAKKLTPEERSEIAKNAASARWHKID